MSKKKRKTARRSQSGKGGQSSNLTSIALPIVVGVLVIAFIVGAIITVERRQAAAAAVPPTLSVPVVTAEPLPTVQIPYPQVPRISVRETKTRMDAGQAVLVDLRGKSYYDQSHAGGAISIPEEEIDARLNELPRDKLVVFYCT